MACIHGVITDPTLHDRIGTSRCIILFQGRSVIPSRFINGVSKKRWKKLVENYYSFC